MALKDWEIAYKKNQGITPIYRNKKTYDYIVIGSKQLGRFDNFTIEKYPFILNNNYEKWFHNPNSARKFIKNYMRKH